jgi:hypothetical protein
MQPEVSEVEHAKATHIHRQLNASYILSKTHLNGEVSCYVKLVCFAAIL